MYNIREVLVDRQLQFNEAWALLEKERVTDMFAKIEVEEAAQAAEEGPLFEEK